MNHAADQTEDLPTTSSEREGGGSGSSSSSSSSDGEGDEPEDLVAVLLEEEGPPPATWSASKKSSRKRLLSKQLSMRETTREALWERRRRQFLRRSQSRGSVLAGEGAVLERARSLTDADLDELRGSIELGFGFNEEDGSGGLCQTLPALDLYFAVNRRLSDPKLHALSPSPVSTPTTCGGGSSSSLVGSPSQSPESPSQQQDAWKICSPGDNPQHVKTRLRHWAQAVACSVRQCT